MELWDAYDSQFQKVDDRVLVRDEPIPDGLFHLVCDVLVKHVDGTFLLMQRDPRKHYGGMWEATAGGSALAGETPLECACRELREETGIESHDLTEVGTVVGEETHSIYVEFLCVTDWEKDRITLQEGETSDFKWVSREELLHMKKEELVTERMQKFIEELKPKDMTVPCDSGLITIRVGAIIRKDGKFLMVGNDRQDYLYSVGGRIKFGEKAEEAVVREVQEETGVRMEVDRLGFIHENYFYGDAPSNLGKLIYEISFFFYMKVPEDFSLTSYSFTEDGSKEHLCWVAPDDSRTIYPEFFRTELSHPERTVKHFVTDEREGVPKIKTET